MAWLACGAGMQAADAVGSGQGRLAPAEVEFLDELQRASFRFFWEAADPETGLVKDRSRADGPDGRAVASIAATGFGLTALCIGSHRQFVSETQALDRARTTLRFLRHRMPHQRGFFYHFVDARTGERLWRSELSSIDTAWLLCGVLTARQHFQDAEVQQLATELYHRVDWPWMLDGGRMFRHGWKPESGFLPYRWDTYSELMALYLLALGSPSHPVPADTWQAWRRPRLNYEGLEFIFARAPLFVHQYSHAWFDFRELRDAWTNYFDNSVAATRAHRLFCLKLRDRFPFFGPRFWGITASDSARGYVAWGGPPELGPLDGTLVPCAAGGSLPFSPKECLETLRAMRTEWGAKVWKRYGFVDAFNPHTGWVGPDVIGIDVGITLLMAENLRSGFVWATFMKNPEVRLALERAGFKPGPAPRP